MSEFPNNIYWYFYRKLYGKISDNEIIFKLRELKRKSAQNQDRMAFGGNCIVNLDDGTGSICVRNCPNVGTCTTCGTIFGGSGHPLNGPCTGNRIFDWNDL